MIHSSMLRAIRSHYNKHGKLPTYKQMCPLLGCRAKSTAYYKINQLIESGFLKKEKRKIFPGPHFDDLPLFHSVKAGFPSPVEEEANDQISLDDYLIDQPNSTFFMKIKDDSMKESGILKGDIAIIQRGSDICLGQMVAIQIEGDCVIRMLNQQESQFLLSSSHLDYPDVVLEEYMKAGMMGMVKGIVRRLSP